MKGFMRGPQTTFAKWSMPGKSVVLEDSRCQCPQHCLCPTPPQKWEKGTRITLMEPEIMVSEEHKYSWNPNQKVITCTQKHQCLWKRGSRKDFVLVALLRSIYMPGKRIGDISVHLLAQHTRNDFPFILNHFLSDSCPTKANQFDVPSSSI